MRLGTHRVLVIDDDSNIRTLLKLLLEHEGLEVLLAPDGMAGLQLAQTQRPDIILLDVAMPNRDGMDVYLDLQKSAHTATIPVLVFSAALTHSQIMAWRSLPNVVDVIAKPFNINALTRRILQILANSTAATTGA